MNIFYRILIVIGFVLVLGSVIAYARGYRIDMQNRSLSSTGIISLSSLPKAAKVFINGTLKGVTDENVTLPPGVYEIEIKKDGFTNWKKKITLKGELVLTLEALLFPNNPSLSPLTNLGIVKAQPLDQADKIIIITENNDELKDGMYLFEAGKKPLTLFSPLKLIMLKKNLALGLNFRDTTVYFSPDLKQGILEFDTEEKTNKINPVKPPAYLISLEQENRNLFDITNSKDTLLEAWNKEKSDNHLKILETYPEDIVKIATDSFEMVAFSPNELKLLYKVKKDVELPLTIVPPLIATNQTDEIRTLKKDHLYIYDKKEDKNYEIPLPLTIDKNPTSIQWYPDSKHLIYYENKKVSVMDFDSQNRQTIYSGPTDGSFFTVTSDGSLIVMANLNPEANKFPDLYSIGIK